jgi:hypothetical protein
LHPGRTALLELLADHFQPRYPDEAVHFLELALPQLAATRRSPQIDLRKPKCTSMPP